MSNASESPVNGYEYYECFWTADWGFDVFCGTGENVSFDESMCYKRFGVIKSLTIMVYNDD